jgi:phage baseplate assembly protein gpV
MSRLLEIIRSVVRQELAQQRSSLLGVVTTVFPHTAADDDFNYEANVQLKHEALELRKVPLAVNHVGVATPPRVGDLVLVQFINGDLNQPVITGRFYHADERPPLHQEDDLLFEQRVPDGTLNQLRFTADGTIYLQRDVTKPEDNSEAKTSLKIDGDSGDLEIKSGEISIVITNDTDIQITAEGKPIDVTCDTLTINGDLVVSNGTNRTTISGNEITGG